MNESLTNQTSLTSGQLIVCHVFVNTTTVASCLHRPQTAHTAAVMRENDESEIIEHHDDEEMEKTRTPRNHAHSFLESVASSEKDGYSSTQSSHRLLAYSDALISIIATVMVRNPQTVSRLYFTSLSESTFQLTSTRQTALVLSESPDLWAPLKA